MARKLFEDEVENPISPLIDVVMNGMAAMFIILMVFLVVAKPTKCPILRFLPGVQPSPAIAEQSYTFTFPVTGGCSERNFTIQGRLPEGLRFDMKSGTLYGIPKAKEGATLAFKVAVAEATGTSDVRDAFLEVHPAAVPYDREKAPLRIVATEGRLPAGRVGIPYEAVLGGQGGVEPYVWDRSGRLSAGLTLKDGRVTGVPGEAGRFDFTVRLSHSPGGFLFRGVRHEWFGGEKEQAFQLRILDRLAAATLDLPVGRAGEPYLATLHVPGLLPEERVRWTKVAAGLSPSPDGLSLQGVPTAAGEHPIDCVIERGAAVLASSSGTARILPKRPAPRIGPAVLHARVGEEMRFRIPYQGLEEPVKIGFQNLPEWLTTAKDDPATIQGKPVKASSASIFVEARDAMGRVAQGSVEISFPKPGPPLRIVTPESVEMVAGRPGQIRLAAHGGTGAYEWSLAGDLPPGMSFRNGPEGLLEGRPAKAGVWTVKASVRDSRSGERAEQALELRAVDTDASVPRLVTRHLPPAIVDQEYHLDFAAEGGFGNYFWELWGDLPPGLRFTAQGIEGKAAAGAEGEWSLSAAVRDELGQRAKVTDLILRVVHLPEALPASSVPPEPAAEKDPMEDLVVGLSAVVIALLFFFFLFFAAGYWLGKRRLQTTGGI